MTDLDGAKIHELEHQRDNLLASLADLRGRSIEEGGKAPIGYLPDYDMEWHAVQWTIDQLTEPYD
jgi:hypothetical protein